ncbi:MAG: hypothetical protein WC979_01815 [Candidatus Pacearchaeota archaeon]|jgi:predicted DNA-binding protein|nr:hypothetical protein [Clostridia bacterium]
MKKAQAFSISEETIKKLNIVSKAMGFNKSAIVESQIIKFIKQIENGMYDGCENLSEQIKELYEKENL